ncbi:MULTISPECIES: serine/threonine protein kinase [unclassified Coleofasciculus]|uniref:serine/threonine protein kinase n=1 Tax=unclassified Coleofasciculus TaxID=2692782 RepID=UPI00187FA9D3|nr:MULTISPECIES: serine/threonine-protein kinase [unclassified Coleofasciculus]MBE9127347.1 serine/threonine protein kinase [Coleofasciculus sp. LEGE 07081]MBE9149679.1 serine/threonine protein kinase [Coleofasciculus sp. LEGE 07092]
MNVTSKPALHQGKYILGNRLGRGVFHLTYRATQSESGETVIIKTLGESLRQHPDVEQFKQQFLDFAERVSRCQHPSLVRVLDWFEEGGYPYLVMEDIPGQTLAELIRANGLSPAKAIQYIRQIGSALNVLHQAGLLHLDIKPETIIRRPESDRLVLCEFGITCEFTPGVMQTHANLLSAGYTPIEQHTLQGKRTPATDLYALAATFYCLLTGRPPLPAPVREALQSHTDNNLFSSDWHNYQHKISPGIKRVLESGLELIPQKRPQTLAPWLSQLPGSTKALTPGQNVTKHQKKQEPLSRAEKQPSQQRLLDNRPTHPQAPIPSHKSSLPGQHDNIYIGSRPVRTFIQPSETKLQSYNPAFARVAKEFPQPSKRSKATTAKTKILLPFQALLMTGAVAASAGIGFGFALRLNRPNDPGSTILHTQQTFPPRSDWPVSEPQLQLQ